MGFHYVMQPKCNASSTCVYICVCARIRTHMYTTNCDSHIINLTSMRNMIHFIKNAGEKEFIENKKLRENLLIYYLYLPKFFYF